MESIQYDKFTINLYDIFANFLPGIVCIIGILIPFWGSEWLPEIGFLEGTFIAFLAFAIGTSVQAIGSDIKRYHIYPFPSEDNSQGWIIRERVLPFDKSMKRLSSSSEDELFSVAERDFFASCCDVFGIDEIEEDDCSYDITLFANQKEDRNDWGYLFKLLVSCLEISPCNRTLRLQALHLATRGLYISVALIGIYYLILWMLVSVPRFGWIGVGAIIGMLCGLLLVRFTEICMRGGILIGITLGLAGGFITCLFSPSIAVVEITGPILLIFAFLLFLSAHFLYIRSVHFEEDVVKYMISEIYLMSNYNE